MYEDDSFDDDFEFDDDEIIELTPEFKADVLTELAYIFVDDPEESEVLAEITARVLYLAERGNEAVKDICIQTEICALLVGGTHAWDEGFPLVGETYEL